MLNSLKKEMLKERNRPSVVGIGDLVVDVVTSIQDFPINADCFYPASQIYQSPGGRCNFLIELSRLKVRAVAIDVIGKDAWGNFLCKTLENENIDLSLVQKDQDTSRSIVLSDIHGNHSFIGKFGYNSPYQYGNTYYSTISKASAVFASGYNFQNRNSENLTLNTFKLAKKLGIIRGFDTGPVFHLLDEDKKVEVYKLCTHLFLTEDELELLGDKNRVSAFFDHGIEVVIIKKGAKGCQVITNHEETFSIPGLKVPVTDTTAAGDCFDAGFIAGLMKKFSLESCALLANCVGAAKVKKLGGGVNVPTFEEVFGIAKEFNVRLDQDK